MGLRTSVAIAIQAGEDNDLDNRVLTVDLEEVLDTLEHRAGFTATLDAGQTGYQVPLGDVASPRFIAIVADREINVEFGGSAQTAAAVTATGATYPTGFAGGETLAFNVDGTAVTATFEDADESITQVINRLNAAAALAGVQTPVWSNQGGQLKLTSPTTGSSSTVSVTGSATATALGFASTVSATGANATPNTSKISLQRMGDISGSGVSGLKAFAVLSVKTSGVTLSNPSSTEAVKFSIGILGDLSPNATC